MYVSVFVCACVHSYLSLCTPMGWMSSVWYVVHKLTWVWNIFHTSQDCGRWREKDPKRVLSYAWNCVLICERWREGVKVCVCLLTLKCFLIILIRHAYPVTFHHLSHAQRHRWHPFSSYPSPPTVGKDANQQKSAVFGTIKRWFITTRLFLKLSSAASDVAWTVSARFAASQQTEWRADEQWQALCLTLGHSATQSRRNADSLTGYGGHDRAKLAAARR